jgi:hypothetical protein
MIPVEHPSMDWPAFKSRFEKTNCLLGLELGQSDELVVCWMQRWMPRTDWCQSVHW